MHDGVGEWGVSIKLCEFSIYNCITENSYTMELYIPMSHDLGIYLHYSYAVPTLQCVRVRTT